MDTIDSTYTHDSVYASKKHQFIGTKQMFFDEEIPMEDNDIYSVTNLDTLFFEENKDKVINVVKVDFDEESMTATAIVNTRDIDNTDKLNFKHQFISIYIQKAIQDAMQEQRLFLFKLMSSGNDVFYSSIPSIELIVSTLGINIVIDKIMAGNYPDEQIIEDIVSICGPDNIAIPVSVYTIKDDQVVPSDITTVSVTVSEFYRILKDYALMVKRTNREIVMKNINKLASTSYEDIMSSVGDISMDRLEQSIVSVVNKLSNKNKMA